MGHEHDAARRAVYDFPKDCIWDYELAEPKRYQPSCSNEERDAIVKLYAEYAGGPLYNAPIVCLEAISEKHDHHRIVSLSTADFYDFVASNVVGREVSKPNNRLVRHFRASGADDGLVAAVEEIGKRYQKEQKRVNSFESCLRGAKLPNAIAVSVLVHDAADEHYLVSHRTDNVIIAKSLYGVTATGSVEIGDVAAASKKGGGFNPFSECAARELAEETTLAIPDENFVLRGFVIGKSKLQPIAIVDAEYPGEIAPDLRVHNPSHSGDDEIRKIAAVGKERLSVLPQRYPMTEAAAYHMGLHS